MDGDAISGLLERWLPRSHVFGRFRSDWKGTQPKGIQELRWQSALLANMSIWMVMPSAVCLSVGFHALTFLAGSDLIGSEHSLRAYRNFGGSPLCLRTCPYGW